MEGLSLAHTISPTTRQAVEDLITEFCYRVDWGRGDTVHELFTEDGVVDTPMFKLDGRDKIQERFTARARDASRKTRHFWTNLRLSGDEREIHAVTNAMTVITIVGGPTFTNGGSSIDVLVPGEGGLLFKSRRLEMVFEGQFNALEKLA